MGQILKSQAFRFGGCSKMRGKVGRLWLLAVIFSILLVRASASPAPGPQAVPTSSRQIETFLAQRALDDLRWTNFSDCHDDVKNIYTPTNDAFVWLKDGKPTPQALAVITALEQADQEGLNPEDYDGPRWKDRVAKLGSLNPPSEELLARFDLALTVSLVRYVTEVRFGRVKPQAVDLKANNARREFDVAQFVREQILNSSDVAAALLQLEPPYILYRRTEEAMRKYMLFAAQDDGEKLPPPAPKKKSIDPGDDYPGVPRLIRLLKLVGDLPSDAPVALDSTVYQGVIVDAVKHFQERHGLGPDGRIGKDTLDQLNTPLSNRVQQLQLTLEHWRWAPRVIQPPPILVNIPEFVIRGFGPEESIELTMRVVVGKSYRTQTPVFAQDMSYHTIFRP